MKCPYCNSHAKLQNSKVIYGRDYGWSWICENYPKCDSYVGCHPGSIKPLGRLANKELRRWKGVAHSSFDILWKAKMEKQKVKKQTARTQGYKWLANSLDIEIQKCHIGMFDVDMCKKVFDLCKPFLNKNYLTELERRISFI